MIRDLIEKVENGNLVSPWYYKPGHRLVGEENGVEHVYEIRKGIRKGIFHYYEVIVVDSEYA